MTVWPALLPPWLRTTISALAVSTSMIFPFPSSPHCAPTRIVFAILSQAINCPDASARRSRDLPTNDRKRWRRCKRFQSAGLDIATTLSAGIACRDAHYSADYSDSSLARSAAQLAVQLGLGLLSEWYARTSSVDPNNPRPDGSPLRQKLPGS